MKHVLVTGGAGFIGRHVCRALKAEGWQVTALDDFSNSRNDAELETVCDAVIVADIRNAQAMRAAVKNKAAVVHLAALVSVPVSVAKPALNYDLNVNGFTVLLDALQDTGFTGRLVYASSAAVYGVQDKPLLKEDDALGASLKSPYAASKLVNEIMAQTAAAVYGLDAVGTRFFNVYGPGQSPSSPYSGVLTHLLAAAENGVPFTVFGDGSSTRDYVYVGDVASAVAGLLGVEKVPAVVNIGCGVPTELGVLPQALGQVFGREVAVAHGPARAGDVPHVCADTTALRTALPQWSARKLATGLADWLTP